MREWLSDLLLLADGLLFGYIVFSINLITFTGGQVAIDLGMMIFCKK